jgi:hypothetical protein
LNSSFIPFSSFFILFHPFSSKKAEKGRKRQKKAEKGREGTPFLKKDVYNIFVLYHSKKFIKSSLIGSKGSNN